MKKFVKAKKLSFYGWIFKVEWLYWPYLTHFNSDRVQIRSNNQQGNEDCFTFTELKYIE